MDTSHTPLATSVPHKQKSQAGVLACQQQTASSTRGQTWRPHSLRREPTKLERMQLVVNMLCLLYYDHQLLSLLILLLRASNTASCRECKLLILYCWKLLILRRQVANNASCWFLKTTDMNNAAKATDATASYWCDNWYYSPVLGLQNTAIASYWDWKLLVRWLMIS